MLERVVLVFSALVIAGWLARAAWRWVRPLREGLSVAPSGHHGVYYVDDPVPLRVRGVACKELGGGLYVVEFPVSGRLIFSGPERREFLTEADGATFVAVPRSPDPDKPWRLVGPVSARPAGGRVWS
ncbi:hypothetical protein WME76_02095 [Sorangium sp. So ce119]|uniref:hypothetical protein n=1 Tax=Sorangium sp. So ce119 TaxID=3133279 RepID=UPI003F6423F7